MNTAISTFPLVSVPFQPASSAVRSGKIELFVGSTSAVEAVMAQPTPANQPVLRLTTNTYESQEDFGLFPPKKPVEQALFAHADVDNIVPNGVQGSEAGYLYPLKKGQTFGIRITNKDVEKFLNSIGVERWATLVANPIRLTRTLGDYLNQSLYKDTTNKPVGIQEVEMAVSTEGSSAENTPRRTTSIVGKPFNVMA